MSQPKGKSKGAPRRLRKISSARPEKSLADQQRTRITVYIYAARNQRYQRFVEAYPLSGEAAINQAIIRFLMLRGASKAREVIEAVLRHDSAWLAAWRTNEPLPAPAGTGVYTRYSELPIIEINHKASPKIRYVIYLRRPNPEHAWVIEYYESLPPELKQMFARVALVVASEEEGITDTISCLR